MLMNHLLFLLSVFQTIYLNIEEFNTEGNYDFVRVYDSNGMDANLKGTL